MKMKVLALAAILTLALMVPPCLAATQTAGVIQVGDTLALQAAVSLGIGSGSGSLAIVTGAENNKVYNSTVFNAGNVIDASMKNGTLYADQKNYDAQLAFLIQLGKVNYANGTSVFNVGNQFSLKNTGVSAAGVAQLNAGKQLAYVAQGNGIAGSLDANVPILGLDITASGAYLTGDTNNTLVDTTVQNVGNTASIKNTGTLAPLTLSQANTVPQTALTFQAGHTNYVSGVNVGNLGNITTVANTGNLVGNITQVNTH
jgi:hypothetical protein